MNKKIKKKRERITRNNIRRPKNFTLRSYNIFISQFIQRDNYGWYADGEGQKFRFKAETIRGWRKSEKQEDWNKPFLKENDKPAQSDQEYERINDSFESHLYKEDGYIYYTSSIYTDVAMFCLDLDSHVEKDKKASLAAANYIIDEFLPGSYFDISTHGAGIHIYVFIDFTTFPHFSVWDLKIRNRQIAGFLTNIKPIIKQKFNIELDKPKGTYPHNYNLTNRGSLCKLPLPKNQEQFEHLVNSPIFTFGDLCNTNITVKSLIAEILPPERPELDKEVEGELVISSNQKSISKTDSGIYLVDHYTNNILGQETSFVSQKDRLAMKSTDATERTRASMRVLFRELGRRPSYKEWHTYYVNNGLNTDEETERRKRHYEDAAEYTERTFDAKYTRSIYQFGEFVCDLKETISLKEINRIAKTVGFEGKMKYQDLDVVMGEHLICMYKNHKQDLELTVPTKAVKGLFQNLSENMVYIRSCNNDRIRGARALLIHIGWITQLDPFYDFGKSQKWGVGENCPRYGDFITFVGMEVVQKVIKERKQRDASKTSLPVIKKTNSIT